MTQIEKLRFEGVTFSHEGSEILLNHVDFDFPTHQFVWMQSEEGAGKSSLLQVMAALQAPQSGKYYINENDVLDMSFEEFLPYRLKIGYTFDYGGLLNNRTLSDNLMLPLLYHKLMSPEEAKSEVDQILKIFGLNKFAHERPAHVSGRVRKLICLLRPLLMKPDLLLMDDPSVGIGQESAYALIDLIHKFRSQGFLKHVYISSYDEKFMSLFEHSVIYIAEGQLFKSDNETTKKAVSL